MMAELYRKQRNVGCRITDDLIYKGYKAILLENELMQIMLLTDRGGEPIRWLHKKTDMEFIWLTRMGLQPLHPLYPDYQMSYPGGWQEMLPEVSYTHSHRGAMVHRGETAVTPWDYTILQDDPSEIKVRLTNRLRSLPLFIEKLITLKTGQSTVRIEETVYNEAPVQIEMNWGYHLAYGAPFFDQQAKIHFSSNSDVMNPITGETWKWPKAKQAGVEVDLSLAAPENTPRDLLVVCPEEGSYQIDNPHKGIALKVRWDSSLWPYVWYWQNYAADQNAPFFSSEYNIGLEMFNIPPKQTLTESAANGKAIILEPKGSISSWLEIEVVEGRMGNEDT